MQDLEPILAAIKNAVSEKDFAELAGKLVDAFQARYYEGYADGEDRGHEEGYESGYDEGHKIGRIDAQVMYAN